jgi:hypothetical protein
MTESEEKRMRAESRIATRQGFKRTCVEASEIRVFSSNLEITTEVLELVSNNEHQEPQMQREDLEPFLVSGRGLDELGELKQTITELIGERFIVEVIPIRMQSVFASISKKFPAEVLIFDTWSKSGQLPELEGIQPELR